MAFEKGHAKMGGRKKAEISQALLTRMAERWTPDSILDDLDWCIAEGKKRGSSKAVHAATVTKLEYLLGKPVQVTEVVDTNQMQELVDRIRESLQAES